MPATGIPTEEICAETSATTTKNTVAPTRSSSAAMGMRVREWVRPLFWKDWAIRASSSHSATEQAVAEDSRANIFMRPSLP